MKERPWIGSTGTPGVAATRLVVLMNKRAYRVDSDGADVTPVTPASETVLSPTWSPDGRYVAYPRRLDGAGPIMLHALPTRRSQRVFGTESRRERDGPVLPSAVDRGALRG